MLKLKFHVILLCVVGLSFFFVGGQIDEGEAILYSNGGSPYVSSVLL